jgi:hypothetical protein
MMNRNVLMVTLIAGFVSGLTAGLIYNNRDVKPLWVNQEIRERVFIACARNAGVDCGEQAKQIATVGNQSGEILFRPKEGGE